LKALSGPIPEAASITVFVVFILLVFIDALSSFENVNVSQNMEVKIMKIEKIKSAVNRLVLSVIKTSWTINTSLVAAAVWP
jgi:hypothetical protein